MRLRTQLIVIGLVALVLPWAGLNYVVITEDALRENERDMLAKFAGTVADYIGGQASLVTELANNGEPGSLYLYSDFDRLPVIDGYPDEEFLHEDLGASFYTDGSGLKGSVYLTAIGQEALVSMRVNSAGKGRIELLMGQPDTPRRLIMLLEAPGEFLAERLLSGDVRTPEYRTLGHWQQAADGYLVELRFPRDWLQGRFGFSVANVDTGETVGNLSGEGNAPQLVRTSDALTQSIMHFSQNFNIHVVDMKGWVRAMKVDADLSEMGDRPPGVWLVEALYRWFGDREFLGEPYEPILGGTVYRRSVTNALEFGGSSNRYVLDSGAAVAVSNIRISDRRGMPVGAVVVETSSEPLLALVTTSLLRFIGTALVATLLVAIGLLGYATWLSLRISRLSNQVMTVMEPDGRELKEFPPQTAGDEIGSLGRNFGALLARVRGYTDYLQSLGSKLSHELRTPLAVVSSSLDNLEHEQLSDDAREYLERARGGTARLGHILTSMSEANRVEQAIQSSTKERLDLAALLEDVVGGYRDAFPEQRIEMQRTEGACFVAGCPELLAQMLDKLTDNARDFCSENGVIRFSLQSAGDGVMLSVANDGALLPEHIGEQLFDSMVSIRAGKSDQVHLGLGLTIVKLIAEYHGGSVSAANLPGLTGVQFTVVIPSVLRMHGGLVN